MLRQKTWLKVKLLFHQTSGYGLPMKKSLPALLLLVVPISTQAQDWTSVETVLQDRCVICHAGEYAPLGLRLDSHAGVMAGSENGAVVEPGAPQDSPLYHRITGAAQPRMPLDGPPYLSEAEIESISGWIAAGASGPETDTSQATADLATPHEDGRIVYRQVARIFGQACIKCHSDNGIYDAPPEALRLDSYDAILAGGDRIVLIPGNAQASEIVRRIEGLASPRMPFDGPPWLSDEDIAIIRDWIDNGALSDDAVEAQVPVGGRVRLRGVMTAENEIDGAAFIVTGQTRIDDRPSVGERAEVRARIKQDGSLQAERLGAR